MLFPAQIRREFDRLLIKGEDHMTAPLDCPEHKRLSWFQRAQQDMSDVSVPKLCGNGRRLNNFCLGSDPEFVFEGPGNGHKTNAHDLGLKPGLAAGCDQNQRLAELRGWPTSSALEHVAGILSALRWMYRIYPNVRPYNWRAGAFFDGDGIGGHVHFGRKRPYREAEVRALDGMTTVFQTLGMFDTREWLRRSAGDERRQRYGMLGDTRPQVHGYEYRTLPSWLDNPSKAFAVLTIAKLCVLDPDLPASWTGKGWGVGQSLEGLRHLVRYYAGRDDDAWILKYRMSTNSRSTFTELGTRIFHFNNNFKPYWGFDHSVDKPSATPTVIMPACIKPTTGEVKEIEENILVGKPLTYVEYEPTFKNTLPERYFWYYGSGLFRGIGRSGMGDLVHNLVGYDGGQAAISLHSDERFHLSANLYAEWTPAERQIVRKMFPAMQIHHGSNNQIIFSREMTTVPGIVATRAFLLKMGLFPLWTVDTVEKGSYPLWLESRKKLKLHKPRIEERNL